MSKDTKYIIASSVLLVTMCVAQIMYFHNTSRKWVPKDPVKEINDVFQKNIEQDLQNIPSNQDKIDIAKEDITKIEKKQNQKSKDYENQITLINSANPNEQSKLFSENLAGYKNLDGQGYFDMP
jgi:uncharacterized membrane-anchored protein YjiN (DUF445 family)